MAKKNKKSSSKKKRLTQGEMKKTKGGTLQNATTLGQGSAWVHGDAIATAACCSWKPRVVL